MSILRMPAKGDIKRDEFILHLRTWKEGMRRCRIHISAPNGEPLIDVVSAEIKEFNSANMELLFDVGETKYGLSLISADRFNYLDYDDDDERMDKYVEEGFSAWLRAYSGDKLLALFLLYDD